MRTSFQALYEETRPLALLDGTTPSDRMRRRQRLGRVITAILTLAALLALPGIVYLLR